MNGVPAHEATSRGLGDLLHLEAVWKSYPRWVPGARTMRGMLTRRLPLLVRRGERRWALRDVSLAVGPSAGVGVIGRNGAGKSTLLRLASGLGRPTRGAVTTPPDAASVLSLGDTFDLSLSGRENALTAAIITGWSRREARGLVSEILAFAEIEDFADAPVRTYSDGMRLRLAFGVIAQLSPSVLVLDEVIAIGDLAFQAKCMERIREMRGAGTALLLASHDLGLVRSECDQALWLEDGAVVARGEATEVVERYEQAAQARTREATPVDLAGDDSRLRLRYDRVGTQEARINGVRLNGAASGTRIAPGQALTVSIDLDSRMGPVLDPIVAVAIHPAGEHAACFEANTRDAGTRLGRVEAGRVELQLDRLDLRPGRYELDIGLYRNDWDVVYDYHWHAYRLEVGGQATSRGVVAPPLRWLVMPER